MLKVAKKNKPNCLNVWYVLNDGVPVIVLSLLCDNRGT